MFAVWYTEGKSKERVVGITADREAAYEMARNLYSIKTKVDNLRDVSTGVFLMVDGMLYTSSSPKKAQVLPLLTSMH